jgi:DNA-directed RNA polymerase II subunit RPB1
VTQGIPRLKELINTVKNIKSPSMVMRLTDRCSPDSAARIANGIVELTLRDVVERSAVLLDPAPCGEHSADASWAPLEYGLFQVLHPDRLEKMGPYLLRMVLSRGALHEKGVTVRDVVGPLTEALGDEVLCLANDDNDDEVVVHLRVQHGADEEGNDTVSNQYFLRLLEANILDGLLLKGATGIHRAYVETRPVTTFSPTEDGGEAQTITESYVETEGINLVAGFLAEGVDPYSILCNDPAEILAALGVEAARAQLLREIQNVIQFDGGHVSYRHLSLLADVMTNRGQTMSITRHGLNRTDAGPLTKCSFEETCDILYSAAADCEVDHLQGVAESVLIGAVAPMGTGSFDLLLNERISHAAWS